jgi:GT2 family glycosyltransferase
MEIDAVRSLTTFQADVYNKGDELSIVYVNGFNAVQARTMLADYASKDKADWVIWLDSDHIYKASDLYKLIDRCKEKNFPMLSATYYLRGAGKVTCHSRFDASKGHFQQNELTGDVIDCDVLGFGFLVMKQSFLKEMVDKFGKDLFKMDHTDNTTEDVYFCRKVKEAGFPICFDSSVVVGHLMTIINQ